MSIYLDLTSEFNCDRLRAVICSGQAVVLHRLAVMSKDGDWILREDAEALDHVLGILEGRGAVYRFGAPLDVRWMTGGWSSHLEFHREGIRVRTDFFTRPPRLSAGDLERIWLEQEGQPYPFTQAKDLARVKMTQREKDYPVIGELARLMKHPGDQMRFSRSAHDLRELCRREPNVARSIAEERPLLRWALDPEATVERLEEELDAERRRLIRQDRDRMDRFEAAAEPWKLRWTNVRRDIEGLPLRQVHAILIEEAKRCLPQEISP